MQRFILNIFTFLTIFMVIGEFIASFDNLDRKSSRNPNVISLQNKSDFDKLDILFIGNSYCYSAVKPSVLSKLGINSYNLGIATAGVEFYELILNDYLENVKYPPTMVFVLVSLMTFSSKSDNYSAYPIHRYLETPKPNIEIAARYKHYDKIWLMFKKSLIKGVENILSYNRHEQKGTLKKERLGYVFSDKIVSPLIIEKDQHLYKPLLSETLQKARLVAFERFLFSIESKGIKVVLFEIPLNKLEGYFSKDYVMEYNSYLEKLSRMFHFFKISDSLFIDKNFRNIDHMNDSGAEIVTAEVIDYLREKGMIEFLGKPKRVDH